MPGDEASAAGQSLGSDEGWVGSTGVKVGE